MDSQSCNQDLYREKTQLYYCYILQAVRLCVSLAYLSLQITIIKAHLNK